MNERAVGVGESKPLPWLAILLGFATVFYLFPAFEVARNAFTNSSLLRGNYRYTLDTVLAAVTSRTILDSVRITLIFVIASVALQTFLGLCAALVLQRGTRRKLWGTAAVRSIVLTAWIMPGIVSGVVWTILVSEASYGMLNSFIRAIGLAPIEFLSDPHIALLTTIFANAWRGAAFSMIMIYAGLQSISVDLYEAADVDGGSWLQVFWGVTLPQLRPIIAITLILATIGSMNTFDVVLALTAGGPGRATEVLSLLAYNTLFVDFDYSRASVMGLAMLCLSLAFTALYMKYLNADSA